MLYWRSYWSYWSYWSWWSWWRSNWDWRRGRYLLCRWFDWSRWFWWWRSSFRLWLGFRLRRRRRRCWLWW